MSYRTGSGHHCACDARCPCVVCGKPQAAALRPFCSRRCADVDLHRWLSGAYALPARDDDRGDAEGTGERHHRAAGLKARAHEHNGHDG